MLDAFNVPAMTEFFDIAAGEVHELYAWDEVLPSITVGMNQSRFDTELKEATESSDKEQIMLGTMFSLYPSGRVDTELKEATKSH